MEYNIPYNRKGDINGFMSLGGIMEERIPRTAGNVYEKADKDTWMLFPREKKFTSFVDVMELTISDKEEDSDFEGIDIHDVINNVQTLNL